MKKVTTAFLLSVVLAAGANAQDYKKVRTPFLIAQMGTNDAKLEEAKAEIDKLSTDAKAQGKAETYLLKAEVYGTIAGSNTLKAKYPGAEIEAYDALKKYLELEPNEEKLKEDRYAGVNLIYSALFNEGIKNYNAKQWDSAFAKFKTVAELGDLFTSRKWSTASFDTSSYLYAGATAQNAQKNEEAVKYYSKIADNRVKGSDYEGIYDFLTKYYFNANNQEQFKKYLAISKELYPENKTWADLEFANTTENSPLEDVVKRFDEGMTANSLTAVQYMDYGDFFINNKKIKELDPSKRSDYINRALAAFGKAAELDASNAIANYNAGVAAYNLFEDATDKRMAIKGTTADVKAKQTAADKVADAAADKAVEWMEKAYKALDAKADKSKIETNSLKSSAKLLTVLFDYKKQRSKGKAAEYDKYDAKFKFYDTKY